MSDSPRSDSDTHVGPSVGMVVRVERPDGTATETERTAEGRICTTTLDDRGRLAERHVTEIRTMGITVSRVAADGTAEEVSPQSRETHSNPYGTTLEHLTYPNGLVVDQTYSDDGNLMSVAMTSHWGDQTLEFRPDGARILSWTTSYHRGSQTWGPGGELQEYDVAYSDGVTLHRNLVQKKRP